MAENRPGGEAGLVANSLADCLAPRHFRYHCARGDCFDGGTVDLVHGAADSIAVMMYGTQRRDGRHSSA